MTATVAAVLAVPGLPALAASPTPTGATTSPTTTSSSPTPSRTGTTSTSPITTSATGATSTSGTRATSGTSTPSGMSTTPRTGSTGGPITPKGQTDCRAVSYYGVRGGAEPATGSSTIAKQDGLGVALAAHRSRLALALGPSRLASYALADVTVPVSDASSAGAWSAPALTASVDARAAAAAGDLQALLARCPDTLLVVAGYDTGALVARAAVRLVGDRHPDAVGRIAAVVLVGDPWFGSSSQSPVGGGFGYRPGLLALAGEQPELPAGPDLVEVCHAADVVCQGTADLARHAGYEADSFDVTDRVMSTLAARAVRPGIALRPHVETGTPTAGRPGPFTVSVSNEGVVANPVGGTLSVMVGASATPTGGTDVPLVLTSAGGDGWTCPLTSVSTSTSCTRRLPAGTLGAGQVLPAISVTTAAPNGLQSQVVVLAVVSDTAFGGLSANVPARAAAAVTGDDGPLVVARVTPLTSPVAVGTRPHWSVVLANVGRRPTTGPIDLTLTVDPEGYGADVLAVAGDGFTCVIAGDKCRWTGTLPAGGVSPPLDVQRRALVDGEALSGWDSMASLDVAVAPNAGGSQASASRARSQVAVVASAAARLQPVLRRPAASGALEAGGTATFLVSVLNTGRQPSTGPVQVKLEADYMDTALNSWQGEGWTCIRADCVWTGVALQPGQSTPELSVVVPVGTSSTVDDYIFTAILVGTPGVNGSVPVARLAVPVSVAGLADVIPLITLADPAPTLSGQAPSWKVVGLNVGGSTARAPLTLTLNPPSAVSGWVAQGKGWSCSGLTCTSKTALPVGARTAEVLLTAPSPHLDESSWLGQLQLRAWLTTGAGGGRGAQTAAATASTGVLPASADDLAVSVAAASDPAVAGETSPVHVVVRNVGTTAVTRPVEVRLGWSNGVQIEAVKGAGWTCDDVSFACRIDAELAPGAVLPDIEAEVRVPTTSEFTSAPWITASLSGLDDVDSNSQVQTYLTVAPPRSDVIVTATPLDGVLSSSRVTRGLLKVQNTGSSPASGPVVVSWSLAASWDDGAGMSSSPGQGWTCDDAARTCTHPGPVPARGALPALVVSRQRASLPNAVGQGSLGSLKAVVAAASDGWTGNNESEALMGLDAVAGDLVATIDQATQEPTAGSEFLADVTVRNAGFRAVTPTTTLQLSIASATPPKVSGEGWACRGQGSPYGPAVVSCTSTRDVAPGGALPPVHVRATLGPKIPADWWDFPQLAATVTNSADEVRNDSVALGVSPAPALAAWAPVISGPGRAQPAGTPEAPSTTIASVRVVNLLPVPASGPLVLAWDTWSAVKSASGEGWTCKAGEQRCTFSGSVTAGASTPPLRVELVNAGFAHESTDDLSVSVTSPNGVVSPTAGLGYATY